MTRLNRRMILSGCLAALLLAGMAGGPLSAGSPMGADKVNINTAGEAELQSLPRIGPQIARRIIDFRKKNGPFQKIEGLMKVRGIGEKVFMNIKDRITVGTPGKK